jgi:hypothetical protein
MSVSLLETIESSRLDTRGKAHGADEVAQRTFVVDSIWLILPSGQFQAPKWEMLELRCTSKR